MGSRALYDYRRFSNSVEGKKSIVEINHETFRKSRYFKMKLAQMPNLTYFPPEQRTGDSFTEYGMWISFRKKKKGRKKERKERKKEVREEKWRKERTFCQVKSRILLQKNHSFSEYLSYFSFTEKIKNAPQTKRRFCFLSHCFVHPLVTYGSLWIIYSAYRAAEIFYLFLIYFRNNILFRLHLIGCSCLFSLKKITYQNVKNIPSSYCRLNLNYPGGAFISILPILYAYTVFIILCSLQSW